MIVEYLMGWLRETVQDDRFSKTDRNDKLQEPLFFVHYDTDKDSYSDILRVDVTVYIVKNVYGYFLTYYVFRLCKHTP